MFSMGVRMSDRMMLIVVIVSVGIIWKWMFGLFMMNIFRGYIVVVSMIMQLKVRIVEVWILSLLCVMNLKSYGLMSYMNVVVVVIVLLNSSESSVGFCWSLLWCCCWVNCGYSVMLVVMISLLSVKKICFVILYLVMLVGVLYCVSMQCCEFIVIGYVIIWVSIGQLMFMIWILGM